MAKRKTPRERAVHSDFGTPLRSQHGPVVIELVAGNVKDEAERERHQTTTNRDRARAIEIDDPLYVYRRNRTITVRQRDAGIRLRALWNGIGWEPRVVGDYSGMRAGGTVEQFHVKSIDDYKKYLKAINGLTPNVRAAVIAVVCFQERLVRHKVKYLKHGLTRLQRFFGT